MKESEQDVLSSSGSGLNSKLLWDQKRKMLSIRNELESLGLRAEIDLPIIAVVGSQSAGKSSLIEAVAGITLPRAASTCTRCPTECRLTKSSGIWQARVTLLFGRDKQLDTKYTEPSEVHFGEPMYRKDELEERIRRAQRAILSPSSSPESFLSLSEAEDVKNELTFSSDVVIVHLSGEELEEDLAFVDLPGIIASVGAAGKQSDIKLVENLVEYYIRQPSCIILLTVTCETDFENQGAYQIVKRHDAAGKRTIGVLTKPDRIPLGEENDWLDYVFNTREPLRQNWFCVKQPGSLDLKKNVDWATARQMEDQFFTVTPPWNDLPPSKKNLLRTGNLVKRCSIVLSNLIAERLPNIRGEVEEKLAQVAADLKNLPSAPSKDPHIEVLQLLNLFCADLETHVNGVPTADGLLQQLKPSLTAFRKALQHTAPRFVPYSRRSAPGRKLPVPKFLKNDDLWEGEIVFDQNLTEKPPANCIFVDEVAKLAEGARTRELPDNYPYVITRQLILRSTSKWKDPSSELFASFRDTIHDDLIKIISEHFGHIGTGSLKESVALAVNGHWRQCLVRGIYTMNWLLDIEAEPFTLNTHYLADYKAKFLATFRKERRAFGRPSPTATLSTDNAEDAIRQILSLLPAAGFTGVTESDLNKLVQVDAVDPILEIMASVRAYFQVAYKRFCDNLPMALDHELTRGIKKGLYTRLVNDLNLTGPDAAKTCEDYMKESSQVQQLRSELESKRDRLNDAKKKFSTMSVPSSEPPIE